MDVVSDPGAPGALAHGLCPVPKGSGMASVPIGEESKSPVNRVRFVRSALPQPAI